MSWVDVLWLMGAAACLTLALVHALVWWQKRDAQSHLLFALAAAGAAAFSGCELWLMRTQTPAEFGQALRWGHVPVWLLIVALVGFVRLYLNAGRLWLAWATCITRTLSLGLNFILTPNINFRQITAIRQIPFLGEFVSVADGVANPWMLLPQTSLLMLVIFVIDATVTAWRRGDRRLALWVGGSVTFFVLAASVQAILILWGLLEWPITGSLFFQGLIVVMGYELSRDVIRSAQLSDELRRNQDQAHLLVEASPSALVMVDACGLITLANSQAEVVFGYARQEMLGRPIEMLIPHRHSDAHPGNRADFMRDPAAWAMGAGRELFGLRKDGGQVPVEIGLTPIQTSAGPSILASIIDITARKQAELDSARQRNELAHLSRVAMLGELSASLAHELNQPLASILSNAQAAQHFLAHDHADLSEVREILRDIVDEDKRAGEVIRRLRLLLTKGEVQRLALNLNDVVLEVLRLVRSDLINHGIHTAVDLSPRLPSVDGDRVQFQQILLNLVMNACDAMSAAPVAQRRLRVITEPTDSGGVYLKVVDQGCGIPVDRLETIFDPFVTTKPTGMGLGLSVCRTIVTAHGGKLWATNNAEGGATVHCTLPAGKTTP